MCESLSKSNLDYLRSLGTERDLEELKNLESLDPRNQIQLTKKQESGKKQEPDADSEDEK